MVKDDREVWRRQHAAQARRSRAFTAAAAATQAFDHKAYDKLKVAAAAARKRRAATAGGDKAAFAKACSELDSADAAAARLSAVLAATARRNRTSRASLDSVSDCILAVCSSKEALIRRARKVVPPAKTAAIRTLQITATRSGSENMACTNREKVRSRDLARNLTTYPHGVKKI